MLGPELDVAGTRRYAADQAVDVGGTRLDLEGDLAREDLAFDHKHDRGVVAEVVLEIHLLKQATRLFDYVACVVDPPSLGRDVAA